MQDKAARTAKILNIRMVLTLSEVRGAKPVAV
jgi:hypothetical protein